MLLACAAPSAAQFSPGPLSAAHAALEGSTNCTKCHEVGKEIAGSKCLDCHTEIRAAIGRGSGYHALNASRQSCVSCHKEHLGVSAKTYLFDPGTFDHDLTGFKLTGKHGTLDCARCHAKKFVRDAAVKELLARSSRSTYLGLGSRCADCHDDAHKGRFGQECSSCHRTSGWKDVSSFDHSRTKFALAGKHRDATCEKCHKPGTTGRKFAPIPAESYADCAPCHSSPHRPGAVKGECAGCHEPAGWEKAMDKPFDHGRTRYPLEGGHAAVKCRACHDPSALAAGTPAGGGLPASFEKVFHRAYARCIDCHADRHDGAFVKTYRNDCAACHTVRGYSPSTFTFARHQETSWPLTGGHMAILCADCHRKGNGGAKWVFDMKSTRCEACHEDVHRGQFAAHMKGDGCASCHTTSGWKGTAFAHEKLTAFPLEGKHGGIRCEACHKEVELQPVAGRKFNKLPMTCESCHKDAHLGQFAASGKTDCARCHRATGWTIASFDHETQSTFSLTGAHAKIRCSECHVKNTEGGTEFTRYKPLSAACESCHQGKGVK
jgi:hypothetical protein